jgi:multidrug resistance efflux pump
VYNLTFQNPSGGTNIIREIDVTQGQHVRQGQILSRLDSTLLQQNVDVAQAAVAAAQKRVDIAQARQARTIKFSQALIAEAESAFHAAQATLQATNQRAQASIVAAQATLTSDQHVLAATQQEVKTQMQAGQAQLKQSIANCQPSQQNGAPTPTSQDEGQTALTQNETPTPTSQNDSHTALTQMDAVHACVYQAQAQYQQVVATAQTSIATVQAQVTKDQAALAQASAEARIAVTTAQGLVTTARAHILVATHDPDLLLAAQDVAAAQEDLTLALGQLQTAQLNLTTNTTLIAPHDGIVTAINGTVGGPPDIHVNTAPAGVGSADTGVFIQLVDPSHVDRLLLNVNEADIAKVKVGQHVQFTLKAHADRQFSGTVSAISPNGVSLDTGMAYPVIVSIASASVRGVTLFPNMTTTATIAVKI